MNAENSGIPEGNSPPGEMTASQNAPAESRDRRVELIVILLLVCLGWLGQGYRAIWEPDEGRYTAVAVHMIESGDWMTPRLNHEVPHFTKPPLVYWMIAGSIELLGKNEFAARLPNSLAWLAVTGMLLAIGRRLVPTRPLLVPLIWCTSLLPFVAGNIVTTDFILTATECLAVLGFILWWKDARTLGLYLMWGGFGLAFLVKGPPGLLPLLPIVAFLALGERERLRRLLLTPSILVYLLIGLSWYLAAALLRPDLIDYWIGAELAGRMGGEFADRNGHPLGWLEVYGPVALAAMIPWIFLAPFGRWRRMWADSVDRFLVLWLSLPLVIFCISSSRMPLYILPLTIPAAILLARHLPFDLHRRRWLVPAVAVWCLMLVGLKIGAAHYPAGRDPRPLGEAIVRLAGSGIEEAHFVDTNGWWGLTFYLGINVEQVTMRDQVDANPAYRPVWERLNKELREDARDTVVYVVEEKNHEAFERELQSRQLISRVLGYDSKKDFVLYSTPRSTNGSGTAIGLARSEPGRWPD